MSNSSSRRFPVTITQLPVTRCEICQRTVAYWPGTLSEALTEHYRRAHPEALGRPAQLGIIGSCSDPAAWPTEPISLCDKLARVWKQLLAAPSQFRVAVDLRFMTG